MNEVGLMSDDLWKVIDNVPDNDKHKLGLGIYCFKIVRITHPKTIVNDYGRVKKKKGQILKTIGLDEGQTVKYAMCDVLIEVYKWCSRNVPDGLTPKPGTLVKTQITPKILKHIRSSLDKFIDNGVPVPELIVYWKTSMMTVKYTFLYEHEWGEYKDLIDNSNNEILYKEFYWMSRKYDYDELKMLEWYKRGDINEPV